MPAAACEGGSASDTPIGDMQVDGSDPNRDSGPDLAAALDLGVETPCPDGDAPQIMAHVGLLDEGAELVIRGCRFGEEPSPPALIWDDFEDGEVDEIVGGGWEQQRSGETHPVYTDAQSYGRGRVSLTNHVEPNINDAPGCQFCGAYQTVDESNELYLSYRFRFDVTGDDYGVLKLARLASNQDYDGVDYYNGTGTLKYQYQPAVGWGYVNLEPGPETSLQTTTSTVPRGEWHRVEMYYRLSSPAGEANGEAYLVVDGEHDPDFHLQDAVTLEAGYPTQLHSLLLPLMLANPRDDGAFDLYVDDVYLDDTRARVELADAPRWTDTQHREIQPASSWSATSITAAVRLGTFDDCDSVYLYVVGPDGVMNEAGYPVTVAGADCGE